MPHLHQRNLLRATSIKLRATCCAGVNAALDIVILYSFNLIVKLQNDYPSVKKIPRPIGGIPDFSMTTVIFHDFPRLENSFLKFYDFPGCVETLH